MTTIKDVENVLMKQKDNAIAARWLKNPKAVEAILNHHTAWNEDHTKFNQPDMVFPLEANVEYCIITSSIIDDYLEQEKEPSE